MTKTFKKLLLVVAVVCFSLALIPMLAFNNKLTTAKASTATGQNLYSMNFATATNGSDTAGRIYFRNRNNVGLGADGTESDQYAYEQSEGWDDVHGQVYKLVSVGKTPVTPTTHFYKDISWVANKTYLISFWVKTSATVGADFSFSPEVFLNNNQRYVGAPNSNVTVDGGYPRPDNNMGGYLIEDAVTDWKQYSYTFTPHESAISGKTNAFGFVLQMFNLGDELYLADIQVKDVTDANLFKNPVLNNETVITKKETDGIVRLTANQDFTNATQINYSGAFNWEINKKYNITYKILVHASSTGFRGDVYLKDGDGTEQPIATNATFTGSFTKNNNNVVYIVSFDYTPTADNGELIFRLRNGASINEYMEIYGVSVVEVEESVLSQNYMNNDLELLYVDDDKLITAPTTDVTVDWDYTWTSADGEFKQWFADQKIIKITRTSSGAKRYYLRAHEIPVEACKVYTMSYWYYADNTENASARTSIMPSFYDGTATYNKDRADLAGTGYAEFSRTGAPMFNMTGWQKMSFSFIPNVTKTDSVYDPEFKTEYNGTSMGIIFNNTDGDYGGEYYIAGLTLTSSDFVHDYSAEVVDTKYKKDDASFEYYTSCTECGGSSQGTEYENTFSFVPDNVLSFEGLDASNNLTVNYGNAIGELPSVPSKVGYSNDGKWYIGETEITADTIYAFLEDKTATAKYEAIIYTLTFSGVTENGVKQLTINGTVGTLPQVPEKTGFTNDGKWYIGDTEITAETVWNYTENKVAEPKYSVIVNTYSVTYNTSDKGYTINGETSVDEGSTYKFTVDVLDGYDEKTLIVKVNGEVVTADGNGEYVIENVSEDLTVTVSVKAIQGAPNNLGIILGSVFGSIAVIGGAVLTFILIRKKKLKKTK